MRLLREDGLTSARAALAVSLVLSLRFKRHALVHHSRLIVSSILTPANFDEREAALALALSVDGSVVLGDLDYRSHQNWLGEALAEGTDVLLIHPAEAGDKIVGDQVNPHRALSVPCANGWRQVSAACGTALLTATCRALGKGCGVRSSSRGSTSICVREATCLHKQRLST